MATKTSSKTATRKQAARGTAAARKPAAAAKTKLPKQQVKQEIAPGAKTAPDATEPPPVEEETAAQKIILIKPPIIVKQLATELGLKPHQLIAELMNYNIFANVNQTVEPDIASKIAESHGFVLEKE